ncbi:hypothetical protein DIE19_31505 [Burkholderia sp. Bp9126]|nr:hypothetical protein DIE19_31505 [Burkholderia sp. Bp9126]
MQVVEPGWCVAAVRWMMIGLVVSVTILLGAVGTAARADEAGSADESAFREFATTTFPVQEHEAIIAMERSLKALQSGDITKDQYAVRLNSEALPRWITLQERISTVVLPDSSEQYLTRKLIARYIDDRVDQTKHQAKAIRYRDGTAMWMALRANRDAEAMMSDCRRVCSALVRDLLAAP